MCSTETRARGPGRPRRDWIPSGRPLMSPGLSPAWRPSHSPSFVLLEGGRGCPTHDRGPRKAAALPKCDAAPTTHASADDFRPTLPKLLSSHLGTCGIRAKAGLQADHGRRPLDADTALPGVRRPPKAGSRRRRAPLCRTRGTGRSETIPLYLVHSSRVTAPEWMSTTHRQPSPVCPHRVPSLKSIQTNTSCGS
jgi:hypothetical protein